MIRSLVRTDDPVKEAGRLCRKFQAEVKRVELA
jgi:hypothetical protein